MTTTIPPEDLPLQERDRAAKCGAPLKGATTKNPQPDNITQINVKCESRACVECSRRYSQAIYAATRETLREEPPDDLTMLSLTMAPADDAYQLDAESLETESRRFSEELSNALDTLREIDRRQRKLEEWRTRHRHADSGAERRKCRRWHSHHAKRLAKIFRTIRPDSDADEYVSELRDGTPDIDPTYIWTKEITTGADHDHWHVHFHLLLPDRATAQVLNAIWQDQRDTRQYRQTDISTRTQATLDDAADYVAKYITDSRSPDDVDVAAERLEGLRDQRLYSAGGRWRPIGMDRGRGESVLEYVSTPSLAAKGYWEPWQQFFTRHSKVQDELHDLAKLMRRVRSTARACGRLLEPATIFSEPQSPPEWVEDMVRRGSDLLRTDDDDPPDSLARA